MVKVKVTSGVDQLDQTAQNVRFQYTVKPVLETACIQRQLF